MADLESTTDRILTSALLPAILVGGPSAADISNLTYNLSLAIRLLDFPTPHYILRAHAESAGEWPLEGDQERRDMMKQGVWEYRAATDPLGTFLSHDLEQRQMPLLVELGGELIDADMPLLRACTHSLLLLGEDEAVNEKWRRLAADSGLQPLADLILKPGEKSDCNFEDGAWIGTISGVTTEELGIGQAGLSDMTFDLLLDSVDETLGEYAPGKLERFHLDQAPLVPVIADLPRKLHSFAASSQEWLPEMLPRLLTSFPAQTEIAVYGDAPGWVYGTLAAHADTEPFHQFDARLGWIDSPDLQAGPVPPALRTREEQRTNGLEIVIDLVDAYPDYRKADGLTFPAPSSDDGIILTGKLPLWLYTALARFYVQQDVPWLALRAREDEEPIVVYSQMDSLRVGDVPPEP